MVASSNFLLHSFTIWIYKVSNDISKREDHKGMIILFGNGGTPRFLTRKRTNGLLTIIWLLLYVLEIIRRIIYRFDQQKGWSAIDLSQHDKWLRSYLLSETGQRLTHVLKCSISMTHAATEACWALDRLLTLPVSYWERLSIWYSYQCQVKRRCRNSCLPIRIVWQIESY